MFTSNTWKAWRTLDWAHSLQTTINFVDDNTFLLWLVFWEAMLALMFHRFKKQQLHDEIVAALCEEDG